MIEEQKKRLDKLNNRTKDENRRLWRKKVWDIDSPYIDPPKLVHIHHQQRQATVHPSKLLQKKTQQFISMYPYLKPTYSVETIAANWIMAMAMFKLEMIKSPLPPILIYLTWMSWTKEGQGYTRVRPKLRKSMWKNMELLGIPQLLIKEADKVIKKDGDNILPTYTQEARELVEQAKRNKKGKVGTE